MPCAQRGGADRVEYGLGVAEQDFPAAVRVTWRVVRVSSCTPSWRFTRIFTKLRLRDRAQAVVLAYETGLVRPRR